MQFLPYGFVRLEDALARDLLVVNAARVSFARRKEEMDASDEGLIRFLMRSRHGSPFEHNVFIFHIKCPIFVAREWFRHRVGGFNEFSMRYAQAPDEYYLPAVENVRTQVGKPGAYRFEQMAVADAEVVRDEMKAAIGVADAAYRKLLGEGVAREVARDVLPVAAYTQFYWTVNARSLMNFLSLRTHETALLEIRQYANEVETHFAQAMPVTYAAWCENDRISP